MRAALALGLNTGLGDKELRETRWDRIDPIHKKTLTVGKSKSEAGVQAGMVCVPLRHTAAQRPYAPDHVVQKNGPRFEVPLYPPAHDRRRGSQQSAT